MEEPNPYAPSRASLSQPAQAPQAATAASIWRDADQLVALPGAELPPRCVKCNEAAVAPTRERKLYWHHPTLYLLILLNMLIYIVVALIVRKKAIVAPGLCSEHKKRRRIALTGVWAGFLGGLALLVMSMSDSVANGGILVLVATLLWIATAIGGVLFARIVYPKRIDKSYVRLKGCGAPFLDSLPEFPG